MMNPAGRRVVKCYSTPYYVFLYPHYGLTIVLIPGYSKLVRKVTGDFSEMLRKVPSSFQHISY